MFPSRRITTSGGEHFADQWSLALDGSDEYGLVGDKIIDTTANFSISFWGKSNDADSSNVQYIVDLGLNDTTHFNLALRDNDIYYTWEGGGTLTRKKSTSNPITQGKWHHYVAIYSSSGVIVKFYVDTIKVTVTTSQSNTDSNMSGDEDACYIGARGNETQGWNGNMGDLALYSAELSSNDVHTLYNGREPYNHLNGIAGGSLEAWFQMGDGSENGSGTTLYDMSANSYNATLTNINGANSGFKGDIYK